MYAQIVNAAAILPLKKGAYVEENFPENIPMDGNTAILCIPDQFFGYFKENNPEITNITNNGNIYTITTKERKYTITIISKISFSMHDASEEQNITKKKELVYRWRGY